MKYGFSRTVDLTYEMAIEKATEEFKKEGFGVLTFIDVRDTLKKKLGVDFKRYAILGTCNPAFSHQVLQEDEEIGLLLPCNVIVYEGDDKKVNVAVFDPTVMTKLSDDPTIASVAQQVKTKLQRALAAV